MKTATTNNASVLIVDDDEAHLGMLKMMLKSWGYAADTARDGDEAVSMVREKAYDAVLTDVRMGKTDGITAMKQIISFNPSLPVILMTAYSSVETAVDALRVGAYDYLIKPLDFDALKETLKKAISQASLGVENRELRRQMSEENESLEILGRSPAITGMLSMLRTVAPTEATVLVTGESGTGKELVARALHAQSLRRDMPLVTVNCAALAETLLESELFGHEKGAFTGADRRREGRFKQADKGTLFLDEIGEMPVSIQAKLLRALQQGEIQRVGSDKSEYVDVRVIAATNRDLKKEVAERRFREDLYFRLNVISLEVPALRDRREDIPLLATHFLKRFSERNHKNIKAISPQCMDMLLRYDWPGNVRELENAIERAVILCAGDTLLGHELPAGIARLAQENPGTGQQAMSSLAGLPLDEVEKRAIEETLRETKDNKSAAARKLGITRATLHKKLRKYEIDSREED